MSLALIAVDCRWLRLNRGIVEVPDITDSLWLRRRTISDSDTTFEPIIFRMKTFFPTRGVKTVGAGTPAALHSALEVFPLRQF